MGIQSSRGYYFNRIETKFLKRTIFINHNIFDWLFLVSWLYLLVWLFLLLSFSLPPPQIKWDTRDLLYFFSEFIMFCSFIIIIYRWTMAWYAAIVQIMTLISIFLMWILSLYGYTYQSHYLGNCIIPRHGSSIIVIMMANI